MTEIVELWERVLSKKIPIRGTEWNIVGTSWAARNTMFYIPELAIFLDIGIESEQHPTHIFITHAHCDHTKGLASHLLEPVGIPIVVVPKPSADNIRNLVNSWMTATKHNNKTAQINWRVIEALILKNNDPCQPLYLPELMTIKNIKFKIELFECTHSISTTGYGFIEQRTKLNDNLIGLSQEELNNMKKNGQTITKIVNFSHFCYLGDTTHHVFYIDKACTKLNENLEKYGTIIVECTFLDPDDLKKAKKTKHMHWNNLKPYIVSHPNINFILSHFSTKYKPKKIKEFFSTEAWPNVFPLAHDQEKYWIDRIIEKLNNGELSDDIKEKLLSSISVCTECVVPMQTPMQAPMQASIHMSDTGILTCIMLALIVVIIIKIILC